MKDIEEVYKETSLKMDKSINSFIGELKRVRTGRATLSILDNITIECYSSKMPINQISTLSIEDSRTISIEPWDKSNIKDIERGIISSDIDISPQSDGNMIRLKFPPLTEDRRLSLVKQIKQKAEHSKVSIRSLRREANEKIKLIEEDGHIGKDELKTAHDEIQEITTNFINKIGQITENKDKEIMEI